MAPRLTGDLARSVAMVGYQVAEHHLQIAIAESLTVEAY